MSVFGADNDGFTLTLYNLNYGTNYATQVNENDTQGGTQDDAQEKIIKNQQRIWHRNWELVLQQ